MSAVGALFCCDLAPYLLHARERFLAGEKLKSWNDAAKILAQSDKDSAPEAKPSAEDKGGSGPDSDLFEFAALNAAPGSAEPEESRH